MQVDNAERKQKKRYVKIQWKLHGKWKNEKKINTTKSNYLQSLTKLTNI